jgi:hypothetical protein
MGERPQQQIFSLSFANNRSERERLTRGVLRRRIECDAGNASVCVSVHSASVQWLQIDCHREYGASSSALRFTTNAKSPVMITSDRLFWCALANLWGGWRGALIIVQPETVLRWQGERFSSILGSPSKPKRPRGPTPPPDRSTAADFGNGLG